MSLNVALYWDFILSKGLQMTGVKSESRDGRAAVATELIDKYGQRLSQAVVEATVEQTWDEISSTARFMTYLPVLTRRAAEQRLLTQLS